MHNHLVNNVIFSLIDTDGITKLPPAIWDNVSKVRNAALDTIRDFGKHRNANLLIVRLLISTDELCRRTAAPERREMLKGINPEEARFLSENHEVLKPEGCFELDVTELSAEEAARRIYSELTAKIQ